ncbi:MAG: UDP-N-acetylmuramate--L-alanine ligase [Chloroflexi bacterium]|nr:UDP-N-acetylmuramate--L-alanine ligase [Chloroflexota bacterium]
MTAKRTSGIPERVHLVGVGGVHLSGIARVLAAWGHRVTGSDLRLSPDTEALAAMGVTVLEGHRAEHVGDAQLVVTTSAAKDDNPELVEARRRGIPVLKRAELIAKLLEGRYAICVAGSHGKTTTTGLIASMLVQAGRSPTYLVGGEVRDLGTNAAPGDGDEIVVEADEFDRAFLEYVPDLAVVTNVEPDHLDVYGSFEALTEAFGQFMAQVKPDGRLIVCADSPKLRELLETSALQAEVETYGLAQHAGGSTTLTTGWTADEIEVLPDGGQSFTVRHGDESIGRFQIKLPGAHNVSNALAGIVTGHVLGLPVDVIRDGLAGFGGARRRFEPVGEAAGVTVMDDYAHHPTEVEATVAAARERFPGRRIVALFQPHTYSRTQYLLDGFRTCFRGLDELLVLATYAAREPESAGMNAEELAKLIEAPQARYVATFEEAAQAAVDLLRPGDVFFTIGAGDVDAVGPLVVAGLRNRERGTRNKEQGTRNREQGAASRSNGGGAVSSPDLIRALEAITTVRQHEPLSRHTTFGVGGPADAYVVARDADKLARIALACREHDAPVFVLGSGSNILVGDGGIRGVVIENRARALHGPEPDEHGGFRFRAESGASFAGVARAFARQGYAGLEWASGIPGTLGGAVVYNAGAYGGCLADVLRSITIVNGTGAQKELPADELEMVYRGSAFTRGQFRDRVVLSAEFTLWAGDADALMERVQELDVRRLSAQPRGRNAGSIFKNPPEHPAWRVIDQVGLRGHRIGDAQISEKHSNFFINVGRARAADVKALIDLARERVREQFGVELELEVGLVGEGFDG